MVSACGEALHVDPNNNMIANNGILDMIPAQTRYPWSSSWFIMNNTAKIMTFVPRTYSKVSLTCSCSKCFGESFIFSMFSKIAAVPNPMYKGIDSINPMSKVTMNITTNALAQTRPH